MADIGDIILGGSNKLAIPLQNPADSMQKWQNLTNSALEGDNLQLQNRRGEQDLAQRASTRHAQKMYGLMTVPDDQIVEAANSELEEEMRQGGITPQQYDSFRRQLAAANGDPGKVRQLLTVGILGNMSGPEAVQHVVGGNVQTRNGAGTVIHRLPGVLAPPGTPDQEISYIPDQPSVSDVNSIQETYDAEGNKVTSRNADTPTVAPMRAGDGSPMGGGNGYIQQRSGVPQTPGVPQVPRSTTTVAPSAVPAGPNQGPQAAPPGGWRATPPGSGGPRTELQSLSPTALAMANDGPLPDSANFVPTGGANAVAQGNRSSILDTAVDAWDNSPPANAPPAPGAANPVAGAPNVGGRPAYTVVNPRVTTRLNDNQNDWRKEKEAYSDPVEGHVAIGKLIDQTADDLNKVITGHGADTAYSSAKLATVLNGLAGGKLTENDINAGNYDALQKNMVRLATNNKASQQSVAALNAAFSGGPEMVKTNLANGTILALMAGINRQAQLRTLTQKDQLYGTDFDVTQRNVAKLDPTALGFSYMTPQARTDYINSIKDDPGRYRNFRDTLKVAGDYGKDLGWTTPFNWNVNMGGKGVPATATSPAKPPPKTPSPVPQGLRDAIRPYIPFGGGNLLQ